MAYRHLRVSLQVHYRGPTRRLLLNPLPTYPLINPCFVCDWDWLRSASAPSALLPPARTPPPPQRRIVKSGRRRSRPLHVARATTWLTAAVVAQVQDPRVSPALRALTGATTRQTPPSVPAALPTSPCRLPAPPVSLRKSQQPRGRTHHDRPDQCRPRLAVV